jgi:hypothetical protein
MTLAGLKQRIEEFWEYYAGDDEWHSWELWACIYFHGYENGECGLRMRDCYEIKFPDLWSAKVYGFMECRKNAPKEISEECAYQLRMESLSKGEE